MKISGATWKVASATMGVPDGVRCEPKKRQFYLVVVAR